MGWPRRPRYWSSLSNPALGKFFLQVSSHKTWPMWNGTVLLQNRRKWQVHHLVHRKIANFDGFLHTFYFLLHRLSHTWKILFREIFRYFCCFTVPLQELALWEDLILIKVSISCHFCKTEISLVTTKQQNNGFCYNSNNVICVIEITKHLAQTKLERLHFNSRQVLSHLSTYVQFYLFIKPL